MKLLLGFLIRAAVLLALAILLADQPGTAQITWHGYVIESSASVLALAALFVGYVFYLLFRLVRFLRHGPEMRRLRRALNKSRQGQTLIEQGLNAIAAGDAAEAGRLAVAARKKLGMTTAVLLLQAQAAHLAHDERSAKAVFRAMIEDKDSAALGYRGLIAGARKANDWDEIERLIHEATALDLGMPWLDYMKFESAARRESWNEASDALLRLAPSGLIEAVSLRRYRAALLIAKSRAEAAQNSKDAALQSAEQAAKLAPDWLPSLLNLAERQSESGHARAAWRTAEKAWAIRPHTRFIDILRGDEPDAIAFYKKVTRLCRVQESDPASRMAMAEAALSADLWGEARRHAFSLTAHEAATSSVYRLLAKIERRESGDERAASSWMAKAAEAEADDSWVCTSCGAAHAEWKPACRSCGSVATLDWQKPGAGTTRPARPLLENWNS